MLVIVGIALTLKVELTPDTLDVQPVALSPIEFIVIVVDPGLLKVPVVKLAKPPEGVIDALPVPVLAPLNV